MDRALIGEDRVVDTPITHQGAPDAAYAARRPKSLSIAFTDVPDPRRHASVRYPLPAALSLAVRHLIVPADLTGYLDWPGLAQVFRLKRAWQEHDRCRRQAQYGITSLHPAVRTPARVLALKRGHWGIENGLHRVKDVSFGEDASLIHTGHGPLVMALCRDTAISLLYRAGIRREASWLRRYRQQPKQALDLVRLPPATRA